MDPSRTRRVVLLVDLHPLIVLRDSPATYSASVLAAARRFLSFPPLSSSLFACKPFFPSLSPLLSTSAVHRLLGKSAAFLSFDRPSVTLDAISRTLASLASAPAARDDGFAERLGPSRASLTAESLFQLAYSCTWEPRPEIAAGTGEISSVRPNLVVMFSPLPRSSKCLSGFLDLGVGDEFLLNMDEICAKFVRIFSSVNDLFISKDVHFCWLDVSVESSHLSGETLDKQVIEKGIRALGWGFCSTDAVALGSALIPFGLIYPYVGCQLASDSVDKFRKGRAELSLKISDVSGMPLECKICDLEVLVLSQQRENTDMLEIFSQDSGGDIATIQLKKIWKINEQAEVESNMYASLILSGFPGECRQDQRCEDMGGSFHGNTEGFFPDQVLELFGREKGEVIAGKPVWQLLLAFLYRRTLCALVSVPSGSGNSLLGILRPFTVHSAIMYILDYSRTAGGMPKLDDGLNTSEPAVCKGNNHNRRKNKKHLRMIQNLTCSAFHEYVFSQTDDAYLEVDIEDLYFANGCNNSKKLRFLQCWMRQIKKSNYSLVNVNDLEEQSDTKEEIEERSTSSQQEASLPSTEEAHPRGLMNEGAPVLAFLEDSETFSQNVSEKIDHVVNSEEIDLGSSAERLVNLAIQFFSAKFGMNRGEDTISEGGGNCDAMVAAEITKLLLKKPKDIAAKYKGSIAPSPASNSAIHYEVNKVREHELQILFRMEILQSEVGSSIEENLLSKVVKDICLLLENIEFNLQGGMFAGESLIEFAGRTIKARFSHSLEDVVHKIYTEMEFLSFDAGDGEDSVSLPNSNSEPHRDENGDSVLKDAAGTRGNLSLQNTIAMVRSSHSEEIDENSVQKNRESAENNVFMKAQERRERARRFSYFTSWRQNLQRVWAPKQSKVDKPKMESSHRSHKRRRHLSRKDMVCETPMMRTQVPAVQEDDVRKRRSGNPSLSKALFHCEYDP